MTESEKMVKNPIALRRDRFFKLSSQIARLDTAQLQFLLDPKEPQLGWGQTHKIVLEKAKVFVKRIPVTILEYNNLFSTKNLYNLPTYFNYGLGSAGLGVAGLGVFRELITHIKTTHWVLTGETAAFPLLYHYRIIPFYGPRTQVDPERLIGFVSYWGESANVGKYMLDRANARHELFLFLEYIPHVLETWLLDNPNKLQKSLDDLRTTITFLRKKAIIHFDAHFRNVLTDGEQIYLTDFELALDKSFALNKDEKAFFEQNTFYDYGEVLRNLGHLIRFAYDSCSQRDKSRLMERYDIPVGLQPYDLGTRLLNNIEQIHMDGIILLDDFYVASVVRYRSIIMLMRNFYYKLWINNKKDTKLPHKILQQLLRQTGFLPSTGS